MAVRATRVRRLRLRKAIERTTLALGALAVSASVFQVRTAASEPPSVADSSPVSSKVSSNVATNPDVGVWVVDGAGSHRRQVGAQLAEAYASAPSVGTSSAVVARVVVTGKVHDVLTNATTAGELLSAMGITPDADDRVQPPPSTPLHFGDLLRFDRVRVYTRRVEVKVPATSHTTYTEALAPGQVRVIRAGVDGVLLERFRVRVVNGRVVSKRLLGRHVVRRPVPGEREVGAAGSPTTGTQVGEASWYDAPGTGMTAAHPWLAYGTQVMVTNLATGEKVVVTINDRGPFGGRVIDLSPEAFSALAPLGAGVMQVRLAW